MTRDAGTDARSTFPANLDWGHDGAARAAGRGDVLVVVDVLSFSTTAATAVARGVELIPCAWDEDAVEVAARRGAEAAVRRTEVPSRGRYSLSPLTFVDAPPGARVVVKSPNGATCVRHAADVADLFVGSLINATATADAAAEAAARTGRPVTVLACGERWGTPGADGPLRFAVEDLVGAGAVLSALDGASGFALSPEASAAVAAFREARPTLEAFLLGCESGRELVDASFPGDVRHAARLDSVDLAVAFADGRLVARRAVPRARPGAPLRSGR